MVRRRKARCGGEEERSLEMEVRLVEWGERQMRSLKHKKKRY